MWTESDIGLCCVRDLCSGYNHLHLDTDQPWASVPWVLQPYPRPAPAQSISSSRFQRINAISVIHALEACLIQLKLFSLLDCTVDASHY